MQRDRLHVYLPLGAEVDDGHGFFLPAFREGIRQRRAAVAHRGAAHLLRPVQMSQRDVVEPGKDLRRDLV